MRRAPRSHVLNVLEKEENAYLLGDAVVQSPLTSPARGTCTYVGGRPVAQLDVDGGQPHDSATRMVCVGRDNRHGNRGFGYNGSSSALLLLDGTSKNDLA